MQTTNQDSSHSKYVPVDSGDHSSTAGLFEGNGEISMKTARMDRPSARSRQLLRVGLFGIGLEAYWPQYTGLKQRLEGNLHVVHERLKREGVVVTNLGIIDSPPKAMEAGHRFRQEDVDLIFLYVATYALSSTVLPVVQRAKVPMIILNLSPAAAIDYKNFNKMGD